MNYPASAAKWPQYAHGAFSPVCKVAALQVTKWHVVGHEDIPFGRLGLRAMAWHDAGM